MNLDERLKEFKQFESDDQAFWDKVIGGEEPELPPSVQDGTARLRATDRIVVHNEIVDSLWEEDFTSAEDQQIIDDLKERLKLYGLDPSQAEEMVKKAQQAPLRKGPAAVPFLVQPQREVDLPAGTMCVEIPKLGGGFSTPRRACDVCFRAILEKTARDLQEIMAL